MKVPLYLGIDIGGTSTKLGLIDDRGQIILRWELPTVKEKSEDEFVKDLWQSVEEKLGNSALKGEDIQAVGIGSAGFINAREGIIQEAVNIGWKDFPIVKSFEDLSGLPVYVENDANIASLGELWQGKGDGEDNIIMITLGTGVGGGIIVDGKVISGENGTAGEIGHMIVDPKGEQCNCGRRGCLETIASATGIVRQAMEIIDQDPTSPLALFFEKNGAISARDIFSLAKQGDGDSLKIIDHLGDVLGLAIANLGVTINPKKVLIGGGVSRAGEQLLDAVRKGFNKYALKRVKDICLIEIASLENDAGIIGAAYLAKSKT